MSQTPTDPAEQSPAPLLADQIPSAGSAALPEHAPSPDGAAADIASDAEGQPASTSAPDAAAPSEAPPPSPAPVTSLYKGRVTRVTAEQVFVELDDSRSGAVPLIEFAGQPLPKDGDEVSVIIESEDPHTGVISLSKRQADELSFWEAVQPGDMLEGVVTGMNKGGLDIDIGGARAFLPASQVDVRRMKDISMLIGEHVRCMVTQVDRTTRDLVVSRRKVQERERREKRAEVLGTLQEGEIRTGTVKNLAEFGAFIDLGGLEALLHVTDMSWGRVRDPRELVQPGQELQVKVLKVDPHAGKVSVGLKQASPDPWDSVESRYPVGMRLRARIARLADFGAFIELEPGVDALLPLSEMSWSRRVGRPEDVLKPDDEVEVVVLKVDPAKRRISVSAKQASENPWAQIESKYPVNGMVAGKVLRIVEFGAFVELAPGIEGLVHISELSDRRVKTVGEVLREGQEGQFRVIKIDAEAQRISLSMKPPPRERAALIDDRPDRKKPARKRPLRGGLASHFEW